MKRIDGLYELIGNARTFQIAWNDYSQGKMRRREVRSFQSNLDENLKGLLVLFLNGEWKTSAYKYSKIYIPKERTLSKLPVADHVFQWALLEHLEKPLCDSYIRRSCSCVKGRGTHDFAKLLYHGIHTYGKTGLFGVQLDAHHYFPNIDKELLKRELRRKILDKKILDVLYEFIDSHKQGLPLGVKISQILANFFLARFDHFAMNCFGLKTDVELQSKYRSIYIERLRATAKNRRQRRLASQNDEYLVEMFDSYVENWGRQYFRFADNIVMFHEDKAFIHILTKLAIRHLEEDYNVQINKDWNVRPIQSGGIDVCGYVFFEDHIRLRKRNKQALCRQVARLRKRGFTGDKLRIACSSRTGFALHADTKKLLRKLGLSDLRTFKDKSRKRRIAPFSGMSDDSYVKMSELICKDGVKDPSKLIMLLDVAKCESVINFDIKREKVKNDDGTYEWVESKVPARCLAIKFKRLLDYKCYYDSNGECIEKYFFEKKKDANGNPTDVDAEYYALTGSSVVMEDIENMWDGTPCPAYIVEKSTKNGKKFIKFE